MVAVTVQRPDVRRPPVVRRGRGRRARVSPVLLAFVLVPLGVEGFWVFWPALQGVFLSFTSWDGITAPRGVGFGNYAEMFGDTIFLQSLLHTVLWLVLFGGLSA